MNAGHLFLAAGVLLVAACAYAGHRPSGRRRRLTVSRHRRGCELLDQHAVASAVLATTQAEWTWLRTFPHRLPRDVIAYPAALRPRDGDTRDVWVPTVEARLVPGDGDRHVECITITGEPRTTRSEAMDAARWMAGAYVAEARWER